MRPPRLRCTLFPLIYPPHLLDSYKRQLYGFILFCRLTKQNLALYVISVRRTESLPTASFRFHLTTDTLAVQLYTSSLPRRVWDFHPLERAHGAQTKKRECLLHSLFISYSLPNTSIFICFSYYLFLLINNDIIFLSILLLSAATYNKLIMSSKFSSFNENGLSILGKLLSLHL